MLPVFLLAVLALAVVPGPDLALIVSHALARGVRAGVWFSVGIAVAEGAAEAQRVIDRETPYGWL